VALVALLHERDFFQEMERFLVDLDLFLSRSFTKGAFEIHFAQSFEEIYAKSTEFHLFGEKLFGPQEVDLGGEGMNPLKYSKELRKRKAEAKEISQQAEKMNLKREELMTHCRLLGIRVIISPLFLASYWIDL
jgi:hypothetical protein